MLEWKLHPLFAVLVPILAAAPAGEAREVRVRFNQGAPTYVDPDFPLPAGAAGGLYALPWPAALSPALVACVTALPARLEAIRAGANTGALIIALDAAGQPLPGVRWQGAVPVRGGGR